ncbi:DTW domain protein [Lacunisphaera limnophila]|uniref:tRNA-uridine aminocarboxypropyltransferase n=1 Tax=Lacunisphaera limnophila TaxID=1838286 RepID=A0A1I7PHQ6_9BACT|nr:DTW domain-containing protein [Lacunisphaera limnophila]AOS43147.1 DTW domain protein [Lacunisphaera limnophila]
MARSVVLAGAPRCARCQFVPRWCICAGERAVVCPLQVEVLIHHREYHRPTSTGRLINRVMPASRGHLFRRETPPDPATFRLPGRELWILHPRGEPLPAGAAPEGLQVLLLDGSWREAARMSTEVAAWGRLVRLPEDGPGRYQLRTHEHDGRYSTVESLLMLLAALGLSEAEAQLRLQFELHVYAGLRTRGAKGKAEEFLASSPIRAAFPALLEEMHRRRAAI